MTLLLSILSINAHSTYTVIGCVSDDTGYLYTGPAGVYSPRPGGYGPAYETSPVVTSGQIGTGIYCAPVSMGNCVIRTKNNCRDCTGPYDYDPSKKGQNYYYEQAGRLKGFMQCPIDDYVGFMVAAMAGLGFLFIRRSNLLV
ncbi:hypothetical protein [Pedobacter insulae]|uniref:Uncharacterized protein n=1 Tax=Pedobacter insulae TaxID=414048 RepID=A0A1I2VUM9_9SPHI|nr:hypothetical protein [Pedobacter insulae]SFG92918.1 hypothetical protein SAMN04489864_103279 [Pedobacter insulae]